MASHVMVRVVEAHARSGAIILLVEEFSKPLADAIEPLLVWPIVRLSAGGRTDNSGVGVR